MQYMLMIYTPPGTWESMSEEERNATMGEYYDYTDSLEAAGVLRAGAPLETVDSATTVRVRDGERLLTDGPYAETKEQIGGYYLLECKDLDEALEWAAQIPEAATGVIEVRPIMNYEAYQS